MAVKGIFTSDANISGTTTGGFNSAIMELYPTGSAILVAVSAGMKSKDEKSFITTWFEKNHLNGQLSIDNNAGVGTTFTIEDASEVIPGSVHLIQSTGEQIHVNVVSGLTLTVERGFADTPITSINGSVTPVSMQRITTAFEEASEKPISVANQGYPRFNYMQIIRTPWDASASASAVEYKTGDVVMENKREAGRQHSEDLERAFWWAKRAIGTKNGKVFRTMDGLTHQVKTNIFAQGAGTSWDNMDAFIQQIFETNIKGMPNERIAFCGNTVLATINKIARLSSVMNIEPMETAFGLTINKWSTPFGSITLMTHPLMSENPLWTKDLYVIHPGAVTIKYLRRTFHDANDKDGTRAGVDADFGVYTSECTIEYAGEKTAGIYTGIDNAVGP